MGRGGSRPGSGRKKVEGRKIQFICPADLNDWLDAMRGAATLTDVIVHALYEYKAYRSKDE